MTEDEFNALSKEERREVLRQISRAKQRAAVEAAWRRVKENPAITTG